MGRFKILSSYKAIIAVFCLAFFIRIWDLAFIPHGFHVDEVISGYIGRFVLLNGKDIYGNPFPLLYFNSFGDYRTILPMYINGLSTFIFGVNEFAIRFPTALIGSLIVFPVFSIGRMIFKNDKFSLIPPIILGILPWNIVLSRATSEAVVGLTIVTFGIYFLLKSIFEKKIPFLLLGNICLLLTYFIYPSFRLLAPLILLPLPFFISANRRWYFLSVFFFLIFTLLIFLTPYGQGRYQQTSLFGSTEVSNRIYSKDVALNYGEGNNNILVSRIFHNKVVGYIQEFNAQYFSYFSPNFLFLSGGLPDRYIVPYSGLIYVTFSLLLLALLLPVTIAINNRIFYYLLYLLVISPLPAALTIDDVPNVNRDIFMSVALVFLISIGFLKVLALLKNKKNKIIFSSILALAILFEFIYFEHQYFIISPSYKPVLRNDGAKELIIDLSRYNSKTKIILPLHDMPIYYLFFNNDFDKSLAGKFQQGLLIKEINNLNFVTNSCPTKDLNQSKQNLANTIVVEDGNCPVNHKFSLISTIFRQDSTVAFRILSPLKIGD